jgi:acetyltransferase
VIVSVVPPPLGSKAKDVAEAIVQVAASRRDIPVMAVLMGRQGIPAGMRELLTAGMPGYIFPESAARALAAMNRYRKWLERPAGREHHFPADGERVAAILTRAAAEQREKLTETEAMEVLGAYGIPTVPWRSAASADEAAAAARAIGFPVVLKVISASIVHKSDVGGVVLGLTSEKDVREGYARMLQRVKERAGVVPEGVFVQAMIPGGHETIVGSTRDPRAGPLLMFGLGGLAVEVLKDVVFRVHPVTDVDAHEMVRAIRGYGFLEGVRGEPAVDLVALQEIIQRVSQLAGEHEAILEMDINPLVAFPDRVLALDARFRIAR